MAQSPKPDYGPDPQTPTPSNDYSRLSESIFNPGEAMPHEKYTEDLVGRTIRKVVQPPYDNILSISFTDGTFTGFRVLSNYGDPEIEFYETKQRSILHELGVITPEEEAEYQRKQQEERMTIAQKEKNRRRAEYEKLKQEFEGK